MKGDSVCQRAHQKAFSDFKEKEILEMLARTGLTTKQLKETLAAEIERRKSGGSTINPKDPATGR